MELTRALKKRDEFAVQRAPGRVDNAVRVERILNKTATGNGRIIVPGPVPSELVGHCSTPFRPRGGKKRRRRRRGCGRNGRGNASRCSVSSARNKFPSGVFRCGQLTGPVSQNSRVSRSPGSHFLERVPAAKRFVLSIRGPHALIYYGACVLSRAGDYNDDRFVADATDEADGMAWSRWRVFARRTPGTLTNVME